MIPSFLRAPEQKEEVLKNLKMNFKTVGVFWLERKEVSVTARWLGETKKEEKTKKKE